MAISLNNSSHNTILAITLLIAGFPLNTGSLPAYMKEQVCDHMAVLLIIFFCDHMTVLSIENMIDHMPVLLIKNIVII